MAMERHARIAWILCLLAAGCSRAPTPEERGERTEARSQMSQAGTQPTMAAGNEISAPVAAELPPIAAAPQAPPQTPPPASPALPPPPLADLSPAPGPQPTDQPLWPHSPNPLRKSFAAPPPSAANPLRSIAPEPVKVESGAPSLPAASMPPATASPGFDQSAPSLEIVAAEQARAQAADAAARAASEIAGARNEADTAEQNQYQVVQVFYGTDRQATDALDESRRVALLHLLAAGGGVLIALGFGVLTALRRHFGWLLATVAASGLTLGFAFQGASAAITAARGGDQSGLCYSTARSAGGHVELGLCEVSVPRDHTPGELEAPSIWRLEVHATPEKFVALRKTERLADEPFYRLLRERVAQSPERELFVFVHGFNVSFEDAARRTGQICYDLKFAGAPVFFSWPAHDKFLLTYPADETNVAWSSPHLKRFLLDIVAHSQARSINLIAHSMGNRALAAALHDIDLELRDQGRLFNQVVLAAPDIDADDFRTNIAPAMQRTARRLTLYASSRDDALRASQFVHHSPRAGDAGSGLVVVPGIDTIDVTAIDSSPWGHSYYGSSDPVLRDLELLLTRAAAPQDRMWLSPAERDGLTYWIFQPERTAAGAGTLSR
jgi:esterase/lipase superfamily enzyme